MASLPRSPTARCVPLLFQLWDTIVASWLAGLLLVVSLGYKWHFNRIVDAMWDAKRRQQPKAK